MQSLKTNWFTETDNNVAIISHASPIVGFIHYLTGVSFEEMYKYDTCGITKINLDTMEAEQINKTD